MASFLQKNRLYVTLFLGWCLLGIFSSVQYYLMEKGGDMPVTLGKAFLRQLPFYFLWACYTPFILALSNRWIHRQVSTASLLARHLPIAIAVALLQTTFQALFTYSLRTAGSKYELWDYVRGYLGSWFHFQLIIYAMVAGIGYAFTYRRFYREREARALALEKQLSDARLESLKMQLQPHFLFNTLNSISMLVRKHEDQTAIKMIAGLSDLLRFLLDSSHVQLIPLCQEIALVQKYLEIEGIRFQDRLTYSIQVDPTAEKIKVPALLLQPLVENALRHGLKEKLTGGQVQITASAQNQHLILEVQDNGIGLTENLGSASGIGLRNTRQRLETLYGESAQFHLLPAPGGGTVAQIILPTSVNHD
ncbi:sensor histidine kinase [Sabulibacter ruber]|uniref:sensor histidine kinase n=1 Tax=Sabulibacter ruber TaxID=2811901 RepID=UPI001A95C894|nr:histidine kinase [Sabulibacter ruber]